MEDKDIRHKMSDPALQQTIRESKEREAAKQREQDARDARIKKLADESKARRAAEAEAQRQQGEAAKREREQKFDVDLEAEARASFFAGNPGASEATYEAVRKSLRSSILLRRTAEAQKSHEAFYRKNF